MGKYTKETPNTFGSRLLAGFGIVLAVSFSIGLMVVVTTLLVATLAPSNLARPKGLVADCSANSQWPGSLFRCENALPAPLGSAATALGAKPVSKIIIPQRGYCPGGQITINYDTALAGRAAPRILVWDKAGYRPARVSSFNATAGTVTFAAPKLAGAYLAIALLQPAQEQAK